MMWEVVYLPEALDDLKKLDRSLQIPVLKAIKKVSQNPLPQSEGGYGKPLGNKGGNNLSGLLKIKLKSYGIRIVYRLIRTENQMLVIVVRMRSDDEAYREAAERIGN